MTNAVEPLALPDNDWSNRPDIVAMLAILDPAQEKSCRFVGGAVRDTLLGSAVKDIDLATTLTPQHALDRLQKGGVKVVPTGIDHGTITAVLDSGPVEITTLRNDVATDGRRAKVVFSDNWRDDAARRDFTINALYAEHFSGRIHDYFDGIGDLEKGLVRFIGDADIRIKEDHLRILRFFRFDARFGKNTPDINSFEACARHGASLKALSRERIAAELLNILGGPNVERAFSLMSKASIWHYILPELTNQAGQNLSRVLQREQQLSSPANALVRLAALIPADRDVATKLATRLRFSRQKTGYLQQLVSGGQPSPANIRKIAYQIGPDQARERAMLFASDNSFRQTYELLNDWHPPHFTVKGKDIIAMGVKAGPEVSHKLKRIEQRWIAEGFPDADRLNEICAEIAIL